MEMRRLSDDVGEASPPWAPRSDNAGSVEDVIAGLADLDANGLRLQWRNHLGGTPPAHLPRWLLLIVLAYQIQVAALGGPDKATLRVIRQPKGRTFDYAESGPFEARIPSTREGADLKPGALLVREWKGKLERVPTTISAAVKTSARTRTSPASGKRLSAAPRRDRPREANPVCTIQTTKASPAK